MLPRVYEQIEDLSRVVALTPRPHPTVARVQAEGAAVRYRLDGELPTDAVGEVLADGESVEIHGNLAKARFIAASGSPKLNVHYLSCSEISIEWLTHDNFSGGDAAGPFTLPRECSPGPGHLMFVETDGSFAVSGGVLSFTPQATPNWDDQVVSVGMPIESLMYTGPDSIWDFPTERSTCTMLLTVDSGTVRVGLWDNAMLSGSPYIGVEVTSTEIKYIPGEAVIATRRAGDVIDIAFSSVSNLFFSGISIKSATGSGDYIVHCLALQSEAVPQFTYFGLSNYDGTGEVRHIGVVNSNQHLVVLADANYPDEVEVASPQFPVVIFNAIDTPSPGDYAELRFGKLGDSYFSIGAEVNGDASALDVYFVECLSGTRTEKARIADAYTDPITTIGETAAVQCAPSGDGSMRMFGYSDSELTPELSTVITELSHSINDGLVYSVQTASSGNLEVFAAIVFRGTLVNMPSS